MQFRAILWSAIKKISSLRRLVMARTLTRRFYYETRGFARPALVVVGLLMAFVILFNARLMSPKVEVRQLTEPPTIVVYNRVPKCASLSTLVLFQNLNQENRKFDQYMSVDYDIHGLDMEAQKSLIENVTDIANTTGVPILYDRHLYFIDFEQHGFPQPVYINLIRDPIEQFASLYYFLRKLNRKAVSQIKNMTLEECVDQNCRDFDQPFHIMMAYFCGMEPECLAAGKEAVEISKKNVEKHFLLVGVQEQLPEFYWALEQLLPSYFEGLYQLWAKKKSDDSMTFNVASRSRIIPNRTIALMKEKLKYDYDFYGYIQQRFHAIHRGLQDGTLVHQTHSPVPMRLFHNQAYENAREAILKKYGRVEIPDDCPHCIFMTPGL